MSDEKESLEDRGLLELARDLDPASIGVGVVLGAVATSITTFLFVIRPLKRQVEANCTRVDNLAMIADDWRDRAIRGMGPPTLREPTDSTPPLAVGRAPVSSESSYGMALAGRGRTWR